MNVTYETIAEVYEANDRIRARLIETVSGLSEEQATMRSENGEWTVQGIVEHLAKAEEGMAKVANLLLKKAAGSGKSSDGKLKLSDSFAAGSKAAKGKKFNAPDIVQPSGDQTIAESLDVMEENRRRLQDLRESFETVDSRDLIFPHPAFGDMNAHDWLALIGGHEERHLEQIERILDQYPER